MSELKIASLFELEKVLKGSSNKLFYSKSEADKVIKEKDKEIARLDDLAHAHNIELLRKENLIAEVKAKLESVQATAYAESVDAGMENRKLKRAMWLARGYIMTLLNRDFQRLAYQCNNGDYKKNLLRRRNRYYELSEKCLKKAKEYK